MKIRKKIQYDNKIIEVTIDEAYELFKASIGNVARRFFNYSKDYEELFQIAAMGFTKAFNKYNNTEVPFYSYSKLCEETAIMLWFRKKRVDTVSCNDESCDGKEYIDALVDDSDIEIKTLEKVDLIRAMDVLDDREKDVLNLLSIGFSQREIGKKYELDPSSISKIKSRAVKKFKKSYMEAV